MAYDEFFGCLLTSFGIPIILVCFTIIPYPLRIITLIISSSFWLVSFLFSSIIWFAAVPLRNKLAFGLVSSVIFQEALRVLFVFCLIKFDRGIKLIASDIKSNESSIEPSLISNNDLATTSNNVADHILVRKNHENVNKPLIVKNQIDDLFNILTFAYVGGLGFGITSGLFASLNMLVALNGPGTLGYYEQPADFIDLYSAQILFLILNHVAFNVIVSKAYQLKSYFKIGIVFCLHMLYSCLTLVNNYSNSVPVIILVINGMTCIVTCWWAFFEAGGQVHRIYWAIGLNFHRLNRFFRHMVAKKPSNN